MNLNLHPIPEQSEDSFEMKIGGTIYEVHTHFNADGRQSVLEQFRTLILSDRILDTIDTDDPALYDGGSLCNARLSGKEIA